MKINGSQILIECLLEQGVDTVFGFPGGAVLFIYDALYQNSHRIRHILTCHEQSAAHAADGYARSTGKVGVCIATSGPGATNLITGIATAYMDSIPLIAITGNVGRNLIGKDSFQEVDITGVTMPITKHNYIVKSIESLADIIREAFYIAQSGRPGPVLIDIPKDISNAFCEYTPQKPKEIQRFVDYKDQDIETIAQVIQSSSKPLVYAGGGVISSGASSELLEFAEKIDCPVATSLMGKGGFPETHPLSTGMIGMHGTVASNKAIIESDCLLAFGTRFSDRVLSNIQRFAPNATIIHVDVDASELGKNIKPHYSIHGDLKLVLQSLNKKLKKTSHQEWLEKIASWKQIFKHLEHCDTLNPRFMMEEIYDATKGEAIITTEVGQHQMWAAQYYKYTKPRTLITSGGLGTMGFGTGAAMGVQIAHPDATVVHIAGDGSFRMNLTELATIKEYNLPIIIVIVQNQTLGMVRQWQTAFYEKRYSQTDLTRGPDFMKLADAYNIDGYDAHTKEEYHQALKTALKKRVPALIECHISIDEKVLPMIAPGAGIDSFILE